MSTSNKKKSRLLRIPKKIGEKFRRSRSPSPQPSSFQPSSTPQPSLPANMYEELGGLSTSPPAPQTSGQQIRKGAGIAYAGLKQVAQALSDFSDVFPPLQTAVKIFLKIDELVNRVSTNKEELQELGIKLNAIKSIVEKYKNDGMKNAIYHRIETFCDAIVAQANTVEELLNRQLLQRTVEVSTDADKIKKAFKNMNILCDVFQMDTQLNIDTNVTEIIERLNSSIIDKLRYEGISYDTRVSSYGAARECMPGTRIKVLADLESWAVGDGSKKVYWVVGMAGTGKSTILHTLCHNLDDKHLLGGSFFCSRASDDASNARLIIPSIAHSLASTSPSIKSQIVAVLKDEPKLAERTYIDLRKQFQKLIHDPMRTSLEQSITKYKIIVIDALDECTELEQVSALIRVILDFANRIPLKFVIASRDEGPIRKAFRLSSDIRDDFVLHEVEKDVVEGDITIYLHRELEVIHNRERDDDETSDSWPPKDQLSTLVDHSSTLFIYAATAVRYISDGGYSYKSRLQILSTQVSVSETRFGSSLDDLYGGILKEACKSCDKGEISHMRDLVSIVVFLQNPLSLKAITSLSNINSHEYLSRLASVIHIPINNALDAVVTPFHASFPDFLINITRCSHQRCPSFGALIPSEGHEMLALRCLQLMNTELKYNICDAPKEQTISHRGTTNSSYETQKISAALGYSCVYWAFHLSKVQKLGSDLVNALDDFLNKHLLHWMECLSLLNKLETGVKSLTNARTSLSLMLLVDDARRFLQMSFPIIQQHAMETYQSALVWLPTQSLICGLYAEGVPKAPRATLGLPKAWGSTEITIQNSSDVYAIAFSPDGSQLASVSEDNTVQIWNTATGQEEAKLEGHTDRVLSVAFSPDGSQLASGSSDNTVWIWNTATGQEEAKLEGHTDEVQSVAFSPDGSQLASGSSDNTIRIWNTATGQEEAKLEGHTDEVWSVAFSPDGSQLASGSSDKTVQIWNTATGQEEAKLEGHTDWVLSVAFSPDGSQLVSGSSDKTVQIWNTATGQEEAKLKGHTDRVQSVAFSPDGTQLASGSSDKTVWIWNTATGQEEAKLEGHTDLVLSVAFSPDGSQLASGSSDKTVQIWNTATGQEEAKLKGHTDRVQSVAFSPDGTQLASGSSDKTVWIWNTATGQEEAKLEGHTDLVLSVAFSPDGSQLASGSSDKTVQIWNTVTGQEEAKLEGHTDRVLSVAFSPDGSQLASGSFDNTVRIWNTVTGQKEAKLEGHTSWVVSVAFSPDGSQLASGSYDKTVWIWNTVTGQEEAKLEGPTNWVWSVAFSPDGSQLASRLDDNTVWIWNMATGQKESSSHGTELPWELRGTSGSPHLHEDKDWIVGPLCDCWIPPHNQDISTFSCFGSTRAAFGLKSGKVIIVDMA
ncbi:WD40 repeat-like protein [Dendrothele bispora CBS 962.96]|uniref:WD40 repeat-like protein n=1 Tax=Dendrothele bispora (strain CBS 962.96) TaxID=1314807 RepID=A0A4S8L891_DENBC|nr:WD40 repeat-like protein [Dendrothele bispora CBS 962.96]